MLQLHVLLQPYGDRKKACPWRPEGLIKFITEQRKSILALNSSVLCKLTLLLWNWSWSWSGMIHCPSFSEGSSCSCRCQKDFFLRLTCKHTVTMVESTEVNTWTDLLKLQSVDPRNVLKVTVDWPCDSLNKAVKIPVWVHVHTQILGLVSSV